MAAAGTLAVRAARRVLEAAIVAVALSLEAFKGSTVPFDARLHEVRGQPGPARVAARLRELLAGSPVVASHADCGRVQDPYTLRCAPQVLGAVDDALAYVEGALERELRAVTDNPLVFAGDAAILSGRQLPRPAAVAAAGPPRAGHDGARELRRAPHLRAADARATPGLPAFLTPQPGLSSGLMIAQYAAAALVNECQVLAHPAGAGSIPTSAGMEDFNSMGAWAALKARTVVGHAAHVVATELVCACQGLEFHRPLRSTEALEGHLATGAVGRAAGRGGPHPRRRARRAGRAGADPLDSDPQVEGLAEPGSGRTRRCRTGGRRAGAARRAPRAAPRAIARIARCWRGSSAIRARSRTVSRAARTRRAVRRPGGRRDAARASARRRRPGARRGRRRRAGRRAGRCPNGSGREPCGAPRWSRRPPGRPAGRAPPGPEAPWPATAAAASCISSARASARAPRRFAVRGTYA